MKQRTKDNILTEVPFAPVAGQLIYDKTANVLHVYNGVTWRPIGYPIRYCIECKKAEWAHTGESKHPFCSNNLEFLEYKYEQSKR